MDWKKRGSVLVALFMFSIVISSSAEQHSSITKYASLGFTGDCDDEDECPGSRSPSEHCSTLQEIGCGRNSGGCDANWPTTFSGSGCWVNYIDPEDWIDNECAHATIAEGAVINQVGKKFSFSSGPTDISYTEASTLAKTAGLYTSNEYSLLCAQNEDDFHYWYRCDQSAERKTITTGLAGATQTFICLGNAGAYEWLDITDLPADVDSDGDSVPNVEDCAPDDGKIYGKFGCAPKKDEKGKVVKDASGNPIEECIVGPGGAALPPEICGDSIDNDCSLRRSPYGINDDCDLPAYAFACSGTTNEDGVQGACLAADGKCAYLSNAEAGQNCCGDDGLTDLGKKQTVGENNYLCLSSNKALVPQQYTPLQDNPDTPAQEDQLCNDQWCWVDDSDEAFLIKTLKKVEGDQLVTYDVVSNKNGWHECQVERVGERGNNYLPLPALGQGVELSGEGNDEIKANRFYCNSERNEWLECGTLARSGGEGEDHYVVPANYNFGPQNTPPQDGVLSSKQRLVGDGLIKLLPGHFYEEGIDFTGYNHLEFLVKIKPAAGRPLKPPFNVKLRIQGPKDEEGNNIFYFEDNVLGDATNGVFPQKDDGTFDFDKWIHVRVKLPDQPWVNVHGIIIEGVKKDDVDVDPKNVYLSKGTDTPLCSGRASEAVNSWLTDVDQSEQRITGDEICQSVYDQNAWLKSADGEQQLCCGDDNNEYGTAGDAPFACWNSQVLEKDKTVGNVEFNVKYGTKQIEVTYPSVSVDWTLKVTAPNQGTYILCPFIFTEERIKEDFDAFIKENPQKVEKCDERESKKYNNAPNYEYQWLLKQPIIADSIAIPVGDWFSENDVVKVYPFGHDPIEIPAYRNFGRSQDLNLGKAYVIEKVGIVTQSIHDASFSIEFSLYVDSNFDSGSVQLGLDQSPKHLRKIERFTQNFPFDYSFKLESSEDSSNIYFFPDKSDTDLTLDELQRSDTHIIIETNEAGVTPGESQPVDQPLNKIYSCNQFECLYPLPGFPPYTITNEHPELYDLYVVTEDGELFVSAEGRKVESEELGDSGIAMLKAVRVPQQVLFTENKFLGCNVPDYVVSYPGEDGLTINTGVEKLNYCDVKGGETVYYCSPRDGSLINSWSTQSVQLYGYDSTERRVKEKKACVGDVTDNEGNVLEACQEDGTAVIPVAQRKERQAAIPGKNLVPNPLFTLLDNEQKIIGWRTPQREKIPSGDLSRDEKGTIVTPQAASVNLAANEQQVFRSVSSPILFSSAAGESCQLDVDCYGGLVCKTVRFRRIGGQPISFHQCQPPAGGDERCLRDEECLSGICTGFLPERDSRRRDNPFGKCTAPVEVPPVAAPSPPEPETRPARTIPIDVGILSDSIVIHRGKPPALNKYAFSVQGEDCTGEVILFGENVQTTKISGNDLLDFKVPEEYGIARIALTGKCFHPFLYLKDGDKVFQFNPDEGNVAPSQLDALSCCPSGSCWNGFTCVNNMATSTFQVENVDGFDELADGTKQSRNEYRCVNSVWEAPHPLLDWQDKFSGYCPQNNQCFVFGNDKSGKQSGFDVENKVNAQYATFEKTDEADFAAVQQQTFNEFYKDGNVPTCINKDEYLLDNRCEGDSPDKKGVWSSRTKFIAGTLLKFAQGASRNDYVLYCSNAEETLVDVAGQEKAIVGEASVSSSGFDGVVDQKVCFPRLSEPGSGDNQHPLSGHLVSAEDNHCVNNFCVLKYNEDRTAFGVSLNQPLAESNRLLDTLGVRADQCAGNQDEFVRCGRSNVWYHKNLNALIFDKGGMALNGNIVDRLLELLRGIFGPGEEELDELGGGFPGFPAPIAQVDQARTLFVVQQGQKAIRGVKETRGIRGEEQLAVEYENFDTDVCRYVENVHKDNTQLIASCSKDGRLQKVKAIAFTDFWWPKLTGSLRVGNEE